MGTWPGSVRRARGWSRRRLTVLVRIGAHPPLLAPEAEDVLYRVAQEGLTTAARHSGADRAVTHLAPQESPGRSAGPILSRGSHRPGITNK
ncbi:MAG TPA: hypothetical protein VLH10_27370 [Yinghuangia sp.]|nr:hypothetical protein [Yinghuangia sp.]